MKSAQAKKDCIIVDQNEIQYVIIKKYGAGLWLIKKVEGKHKPVWLMQGQLRMFKVA